MNTLILGKNEINAEVEKGMAGKGVGSVIMRDAANIIKFRGEPGDYVVTTPEGKFSFTSVIVTEPPRFDAVSFDGEVAINLMDDAATGRLDDLKTSEKIVILLDHGEEAPEYITAKAICLAKRLAEKKKEVVFLAKVVKSGYGDNELKYSEARNAGVTFVKYETVSVCYDEEADRFRIAANDGVFDLNIATPYLISLTGGETPELKSISKKLRLSNRPGGRINDDRFFMYPAFTARRGIYYLNPALIMPDKEQSVGRAIPSIIEDMAAIKADGYLPEPVRGWQFPEVDADKCAFCYSCFRACPHGALEPDHEASAMKVIESECQACGTCVAICPGEAIARKDFAARPPGKGKCKIYCCENGAAEAFEEILPALGACGQAIDSERVACGGSVGVDRLAGDFKNYDKIIVACCVEDACRHIDGDRRACKQAERAAGLLKRAKLEGKSVSVIKASHAGSGVLKDNIMSVLEG